MQQEKLQIKNLQGKEKSERCKKFEIRIILITNETDKV